MIAMKKIYALFLIGIFLVASGCGEDYLERTPTTSITDEDLFTTVGGAETALNGLIRSTYMSYNNHGRFGQKSIDIAIDFMGEDFLQLDRGYGWFVSWYQYLATTNIQSLDLEFAWSYYYDLIDNANIIIADIDKAKDFGAYENKANAIKGQAYAFRAFSHYQLVQMFAARYEPGGANTHLGVPLILNTSGEPLPRNTVAEVYAQVVKDIDEAVSLLSKTNVARANKSYINLSVAQGIKARIALTMGDWATAATQANAARQGYSLTSNYMNGWNRSADTEWMWGAVLIDEQQTSYASFFSHVDPLFGGYASLGSQKVGSTEIMDYMGDTDQRKLLFQPEKTFSEAELASSFDYPNKKRVCFKFTGKGGWTNDYLYMKAGEMYLIEAEALARQGKNTEAQTVIFELTKNRDPEAVAPAQTGDALIQHILMERRCDLWGDGFRLFDIKRLNIDMDRRNKGHNETFWDKAGHYPAGSKYLVFLIPKQEMDSNPKMVQNEL
jgi:tetratricopeptide (TPR) repeat protein